MGSGERQETRIKKQDSLKKSRESRDRWNCILKSENPKERHPDFVSGSNAMVKLQS